MRRVSSTRFDQNERDSLAYGCTGVLRCCGVECAYLSMNGSCQFLLYSAPFLHRLLLLYPFPFRSLLPQVEWWFRSTAQSLISASPATFLVPSTALSIGSPLQPTAMALPQLCCVDACWWWFLRSSGGECKELWLTFLLEAGTNDCTLLDDECPFICDSLCRPDCLDQRFEIVEHHYTTLWSVPLYDRGDYELTIVL